MASTYTPSYQGVGDNLLRAGFMVAEMEKRAERVRALAEAIAPVYHGPDDPHRGRYKASFSVSSTDHGGSRGNRAAGVITSSDPQAFLIEFGDSKQAGHYTLRTALAAGR
jgi:hypothetical protein